MAKQIDDLGHAMARGDDFDQRQRLGTSPWRLQRTPAAHKFSKVQPLEPPRAVNKGGFGRLMLEVFCHLDLELA